MKKKKSALRKVFSGIGYAAVAAIALMLVFVLVCNLTGRMPFIAGYTTIWVRTDSMETLIPEQSYILVREATGADVALNDVIVFKSDDPAIKGSLNTHRVVEIIGENAEFVTKGDHNSLRDSYTAKAENVVGVYVRNLPVLSVVGRALASKPGMIAAIALMFIIIIAIYVPDIVRASREKSENASSAREEEIEERIKEEVEKLRSGESSVPDNENEKNNHI